MSDVHPARLLAPAAKPREHQTRGGEDPENQTRSEKVYHNICRPSRPPCQPTLALAMPLAFSSP